ncbi:uncharacterized protein LOC134796929 [Cydia splendana]|uniref:uncharacterized protein LOC134796929 n=1 Tax=Cydia splendana TaxID=1100963 RepID=UPI0021236642
MGVPMLKNCCFCASLHTGMLIIAYLYSVWALVELTGYCLIVTFRPLESVRGDGGLSMSKYVTFVVSAAVTGVHLLCSLLLILAAYKKLSYLTLPWTIVTGLLTAMYFVLCLTGISLVLQDSVEQLSLEAVFICVQFARICISVYCIMVVHSRHKQIMAEEDERRFMHSGRINKDKTEDYPLIRI